MKYVLIALMAMVLVGCNNSTKTYNTIEDNITVDEPYDVPGGMAIIVDDTTDSQVIIEDDTIIINCGGQCGDITIGTPVAD